MTQMYIFDNMKQTPIPEKINIKIKNPNDLLQTVIGMIVSTSNSLIDVLTEQQKEIDELKNHVHIAHVNSLVGQTEAPYTAMRSTGEVYCKCPEPLPCHCHNPSMCSYCSKPIKL